MEQEIFKKADEEVEKILENNWQQQAKILKEQTAVFLHSVEDIRKEIESYNLGQRKIYSLKQVLNKANNPEQVQKDIDQIKKNNTINQNNFLSFLALVDNYSKNLNSYLEHSIKTIYVYRNSKGTVKLYELTGEIDTSVIKFNVASKGRGAVGTYKSPLRNREKYTKLEVLNNDGLIEAYNTAYNRGMQIKKQLNSSDKAKEKKLSGMWVYWKDHNRWDKMKVNTVGDLAEAYAYFALDDARNKKFATLKTLETRVKHFMLDGVAKVDNISGVLYSDVFANKQQYAIKSMGASFMGYQQVLKIADTIMVLAPKDIVSYMKKEYEKLKQKNKLKKGQRNKIFNSEVNKNIDEILEQLIDNLEQP